MSGSGKTLINIIYESCLIQLNARGIKISKSLKMFQAPKDRNQERKRSSPSPSHRIGRAIRLLSSISRVQAGGFSPRKAGNRPRREEAGKDQA